MKPISGQDDIGVEDFIKIVKKAKSRCSQQALLLDYIIAEKIINHAERAIRYTQINSYTDLFNTLRQNLTQIGSVSALRSKLESCKLGPTETIQNFNLRFRQGVNELKYAVQSEHPGPMERKIAINIEEKESTKRYLLNLRREIGLQVKAQKPTNLSEAQNYAVEMEMWLKEAQPTLKLQPSFRPPIKLNQVSQTKQFAPRQNLPHVTGSTNRTNSNIHTQEKSRLTCHKCGKLGHFAQQCQVRTNFPMGTFGTRPPQAIRNIQNESEECLEYFQIPPEEEREQIHYEESAECLPSVEDCNLYLENEAMDQPTNY